MIEVNLHEDGVGFDVFFEIDPFPSLRTLLRSFNGSVFVNVEDYYSHWDMYFEVFPENLEIK